MEFKPAPVALNAIYRKDQAVKIDTENQRLLRAIVSTRPEVEQAQSQLESYERNTVSYKLRRERLAAQDPAQGIMLRNKNFMQKV